MLDQGTTIRFKIDREQARMFYTTPNKNGHCLLSKEAVKSVKWEDIEAVLNSTPRMYKLWYGK
jgi:hypothetical protein